MSWNLEGKKVSGLYLNLFPVGGEVVESRVKYGGSVQHTVVLNQPIQVFGSTKDRVLLGESEILLVL
jgi:hypothetical protein